MWGVKGREGAALGWRAEKIEVVFAKNRRQDPTRVNVSRVQTIVASSGKMTGRSADPWSRTSWTGRKWLWEIMKNDQDSGKVWAI